MLRDTSLASTDCWLPNIAAQVATFPASGGIDPLYDQDVIDDISQAWYAYQVILPGAAVLPTKVMHGLTLPAACNS